MVEQYITEYIKDLKYSYNYLYDISEKLKSKASNLLYVIKATKYFGVNEIIIDTRKALSDKHIIDQIHHIRMIYKSGIASLKYYKTKLKPDSNIIKDLDIFIKKAQNELDDLENLYKEIKKIL